MVTNSWLSVQRRSLLGLERLAQRIRPRHVGAAHRAEGRAGELEALFFLRRAGYTVVERRWRAPELNGDLDLVAWEGEQLCVIEVKTRTGLDKTARDLTPAAAAIDEEKRRMLRGMARAYRRTLPRELENERTSVRFDVVSVYLVDGRAECELLRGAFLLNPAG